MTPPARRAIHAIFFASGAVALICEVVWTRWLTGVLGNASTATAIVLAVFMAGLGTGSWLAAKFADRITRPIRAYAIIELAVVGLVVLPLLGTKSLAFVLQGLASQWGPTSIVLDIARLLIAVLTIGPPTILMGMSLPLVVKAMARSSDLLGRRTASAYAVNSLGGVTGTLLAGFFLIESFGLLNTAMMAGGLAAAVGGFAFLLDRKIYLSPPGKVALDGDKAQKRVGSSPPVPATRGSASWILLAASVSGFCALGYETIWSRVLSLLTLNTTYAFSLMLAVLLLGLSVGSWLMSKRLDRLADPAAWFVAIQTVLSLYALLSLSWAPVTSKLSDAILLSGNTELFAPWFSRPLMMASCLLLVPSILMGASLPTACRLYASMTEGIARPVGRIYAANTFGSVAGALVIGLLVIPLLGTWWAMAICSLLGALTALGTAWLYTAEHRRIIYVAATSMAAIVAVSSGFIYGDTFVMQHGLGLQDDVIFRSEDDFGLTEVVEDRQLGTRWMLTNRLHWEGSTLPRAIAEQRRQGVLPLMLHKTPRRVLEIGLGTGIKHSVLRSPLVERSVIVEISPGVIEASRLFGDYNEHISSKESKVEIVCADGRNFVALTPEKFDLIVNGLLTPYRAGVSRLYTVEHFRSCRAKLEQDGMFVVWVAIRQIAPNDLKVITRTLLEVFPHTTMWLDGYYLAFVSPRKPLDLQFGEIQRRCINTPLAGVMKDAGLDSPLPLLSTFLAGPETLRQYSNGQPLNTEDRPVIEFRTPRLGDQLNSNELAAETLGTLSLLQEPICPAYAIGNEQSQMQMSQAQKARWTARQGLIAKCYGRHLEAAQLFREALTEYRSDNLARHELEIYLVAYGKQCFERGLLEQAHRIFQEAVQVNPQSVGALASLAAFEEQAGNHREATRLWNRAAANAPHNRHIRRRSSIARTPGASPSY